MGSLIYAPQVAVYIRTASGITYDISDDVIRGRVERRSDGVSTAALTIQNSRRKYDEVFTPNDRIIVLMKRLAWMRVFTGYLNRVPLVSIWPTEVELTASCTLKRMQYWYWDPMTQATQTMISQAFAAASGNASTSDGGAGAAALAIMNNVMGWPPSKAHIGAIPTRWLDIAYKIAQQVQSSEADSDRLAAQFYSNLSAGGIVAGVPNGPSISGVLKGSYGPFSGDQLRNAEIVYSAGVSKGASQSDITVALMVSMAAANLKNSILPDTGGYLGLFHQNPKDGWGTLAQLVNPTYAASAYYTALLAIGTRSKMTLPDQARASAKQPGAADFSAFQAYAQQMVADISKAQASNVPGASTNPLPNGFDPNSRPTGTGTGADWAAFALNFVRQYPTIPYTEAYGGTQMAVMTANPPPGLDCSSFVQTMYLRYLGALYNCPRVASDQSGFCTQMLTAAQGLRTPGALMFKGPGKGSAYHVEMSLGDGERTVGSHHGGTYASIGDAGAGYWDYAGLMPRMTYSIGGGAPTSLTLTANATTSAQSSAAAGAAGTGAAPNPTSFSSTPGYDPNDPFDKLFGNQAWMPDGANEAATNTAEALVGIRALINDQPLLPYLMNLFNSTMRSFCSAPNGDLIAWFPDYYGLWGTAAKMVVEPIEVMDFTVQWSDDAFVTHMFTMAGMPGNTTVDIGSGSIGDDSLQGVGPNRWTQTLGIASIDVPAIMYALFGIDATPQQAQDFASFIYKRFGARPNYEEMPGLQGPKAEFFSALFLFMRRWAYQYNADIPLTFMPELWPGMLIQIPAFDFQAYVTTVTHTFRFGQGGGFQTTVNIAAPARLPKSKGDRDNVLLGLPLAGGLATPATPPTPRSPGGRMLPDD
jgi:cell wall-associated NlpC family hydrolase